MRISSFITSRITSSSRSGHDPCGVAAHTDGRDLHIFGEPAVNVLNLALDQLASAP